MAHHSGQFPNPRCGSDEAKGRIQFHLTDLALADVDALEDCLAEEASLLKVSLVKQEIQLGCQLQGNLKVGFHQVLATCKLAPSVSLWCAKTPDCSVQVLPPPLKSPASS